MPRRSQVLAAFAAIYLLWGATYLAIRIGDQSVPPLVLAAARFVIAGAIAYAWGRASGAASPTRAEWRSLFLLGALMFLAGYGALFWAETRVASGVAAVLVALIPMWVAALEAWVFRTAPASPRILAGCLLGALGVALLVGGLTATSAPLAALSLLAASIGWALGTILMHRISLPRSAMVNAGGQMLLGGLMLAAAAAALGEFRGDWPAHLTAAPLWSLAYLVIAGSLIGYFAYVWLLDHVSAVRVSSYALVNPVVALLLGYALAGERLTARAGAGAAVILAALALVLARTPAADTMTAPNPNPEVS